MLIERSNLSVFIYGDYIKNFFIDMYSSYNRAIAFYVLFIICMAFCQGQRFSEK